MGRRHSSDFNLEEAGGQRDVHCFKVNNNYVANKVVLGEIIGLYVRRVH